MSIKQLARNLRKQQTPSEKLFWEYVRNRKLNGKKFLRQHPISFVLNGKRRLFIADFYCAEHQLIIELDGRIHENQKEYDEMREWIINELGYKILRFKNSDIEKSPNHVFQKITDSLVSNISKK
jgi:very-short-patch-repair endonuclease